MAGWRVYEKNTLTKSPATSSACVVRFAEHVELKGRRARTVEAYVAVVRLLERWAQDDPAQLEQERVREFFVHLVRERGYAPKSIRQARAALVSFYTEMLGVTGWSVFDHIKTKDRQTLPAVLSREEVRRILSQVKVRRFAVPLRLIYLCGLRLSECLHIEVRDIHRQQQRLHVREGKGCKDRYVPLPQAALDDLTAWWRWHRHPKFLFPAMGHAWRATERRDASAKEQAQRQVMHRAEHPMSVSGLQRVFQLAVKASGVQKPATIHTLRHSYATHLLEEGVSLRFVSQYLGHATLEQTLVYTHLTAASEAQTREAVGRLAAVLDAQG